MEASISAPPSPAAAACAPPAVPAAAAAPSPSAPAPAPPTPPAPSATAPAATATTTAGTSSSGASASASVAGAGASEPVDHLSQYKRLLSLARRSLEENQRQLAEKESTIARLSEQLEVAQTKADAAAASHGGASASKARDGGAQPQRVLLRVMDGNASWVLIDYEDEDEVRWQYFEDEIELQDHVRRDSGEPLTLPHPCLTPKQSAKVVRRELLARSRFDSIYDSPVSFF